MESDNDNFDPWSSIGLQALLILNRLRLQTQVANLEEQKPYETDAERNDRNHRSDSVLDAGASAGHLGEITGDVDGPLRNRR